MNISKIKEAISVTNIVAYILLMIICTKITVQLKPVPVTLQTLGIIFTGLTCRKIEAIYAVFFYILYLHTPFNCDTQGFIFGITGGYITGFLLATIIITYLRDMTNCSNFISALIGVITIYICGITQLSYFIGGKSAILCGFIPFIAPEILKFTILTGVMIMTKCDD